MDRLVELIVRAICACAMCARVLPGVEYARYEPGSRLKVLLVGYNGARNTGSDVRVAALARQLVELVGADKVEISAMTLDASSTAPYFERDVRQVEIGGIFFAPLLKACSEHHVAILCEGSTLKSKFANALTLYTCEAAGVMRAQGKPCIAYGSEVGAMDPFLERAARDLCTDVRFAVRSTGSLEALRRLGFDGFLGTDTAWRFDSSAGAERAREVLRDGGWDGERPLLGVAPVNPFCWPVKPSLRQLARTVVTKDRSLQFKGWYFFSWSQERERLFHEYANAMAQATLTFARERGFQPVVIGMEQLDAQACELLARGLGGAVPVVLSRDYDGYVISEVLRSLTLLATSRYHAQVLATGALVPAVAVSMDERLDNLATELGSDERQLLHVADPELAPRLLLALDYAYDNAPAIRARLEQNLDVAKHKLDDMGAWLAAELGKMDR